jgi:uncharacterized protein (DUF2336 family)
MSIDVSSSASNLHLNEEDVKQLLEGRSEEIVHAVAQQLSSRYSQEDLSEQDRKAAEHVFRLMLRETESRVRIGLAERLKESSDLSRDLAMTMACDIHEVALPMLQFSDVFTDDDMMDIILASDDTPRLLAIARREKVSEPVSATLIHKKNEAVATTLVHNAGADISEQTLTNIVNQYPENKPLMSALVSRPDLTPTVAERMVHLVSESLANALQQKYELPEADIKKQVEKVREEETLTIIHHLTDLREIEKLALQLKAHNRLTTSLIFTALSQGNRPFFHVALAKLANVPLANAKKLLDDKGGLGLRALYNEAHLPTRLYPALRVLLKALEELEAQSITRHSKQFTDELAKRVIALAESQEIDNLSYLLALIRQRPQPAKN